MLRLAPAAHARRRAWLCSQDEESHVDAVMDTPVVDFYNEILLTYPNAKVILTGAILCSRVCAVSCTSAGHSHASVLPLSPTHTATSQSATSRGG